MADTKISDLTEATNLVSTDLLVIAQEDTANKKVTFPTLRDEVLSDHLGDTSDAHDASAISVLDSGANYTATDVEGVLAEIAPQLGASGSPEFDYAQITTDPTVASITEASPDTLISLPARSYDGSTTIIVEIFATTISTNSATGFFDLYDGSTFVIRFAAYGSGYVGAMYARTRLTPTNGSHTYHLKAWATVASQVQVFATSPRTPASIRTLRA